MNMLGGSSACPRQNLSRRGWLIGTGAGLLGGGVLGWLAQQHYRGQAEAPARFSGRSVETARPDFAMPGPYPGRVIEVRHAGSVNERSEIIPEAVSVMMARGMCALTGADHPQEAWRRFFEPGDVVGIKVNPVGRARGPRETGSRRQEIGVISSPAVLIEIVEGLKSVGIPTRNIIVFERYADEFRLTGYEALLRTRPLEGVRWYASSSGYNNTQVALNGQEGRDRDPNVIGYDPDVFVSMGFAYPEHDPRDDRRYRSHLSAIVTRLCNKIITIPCLKDHRSAGVTLALKNMSHGMNNNVCRSHLPSFARPNHASHPNQCNTFIPTAAGQAILREKATLHVLDGLIGNYEGGPGSWNNTWATWPRKSLFFATDPVAMDHVGWDIIDQKRAQEGWLPVAQMGTLTRTPLRTITPRLTAMIAAGDNASALAALADLQRMQSQPNTEGFDRRQPEHIILAGTLGLGIWEANRIEHRTIWAG